MYTPYVTINFIPNNNNIVNTTSLYDDNINNNIVVINDNKPIYDNVIPVSGTTLCDVRTYHVLYTHVC